MKLEMKVINAKEAIPIKELPFLLRCLAESNCLERFCRPIPNRSDKAPCC